jgi:hypothetical protein
MKKLLILITVSLFGGFGWLLGARFGLMTGYIFSFIGSLLGVYIGVRINRDYMA